MLSNVSETLHSQRKSKIKQITKIWSLYIKRQKFGTTMLSPEGLEDSPFTKVLLIHTKKSKVTKDKISTYSICPPPHPDTWWAKFFFVDFWKKNLEFIIKIQIIFKLKMHYKNHKHKLLGATRLLLLGPF